MTTILEDAQEAIFGARNVSYGHPRDNFTHTAALWNAHLGLGNDPDSPIIITPQLVAELMILLKLSRLQNGYHRDSVVDIAGYAGTIERLQEPEAPTGTWVQDGRRYWSDWSLVPKDQPVNSSDETDNMSPWYGDGAPDREEGEWGEPPWREWIDPDAQAEVEENPQTWMRLRNVLVGTVVSDRDGDKWLRVRGGVKLWDQPAPDQGYWGEKLSLNTADNHDMFAPFTEVTE